jgi:hypothetical protein
MKNRGEKKGYRVLTESEKRDEKLLGALKTVRKAKKPFTGRRED